MEDLMQSQIQDSCKLSLPEGLRDLMSDISREVLRAQPPDLYNFITNYLEALMLTRETLSIACRVCRNVCNCCCQPELEEELRKLGLEGDDLETAQNVVMEYFEKDEVKEGNLLMKLMEKTNIDEEMLPAIQNAVRAAFLKHQLEYQIKTKVAAEEANDRGQIAAKHTMEVHESAENEYLKTRHKAALVIQTCYRAYLERRLLNQVKSKAKEKNVKIKASEETVRLWRKDLVKASTSRSARKQLGRLSSISLAGSLINLPKYIPYSIHDSTSSDNEFEDHEKENKNTDYTLETSFKNLKTDQGKKIIFHKQHILHEIDYCSIDDDVTDSDVVEEDILSSASEKSMEVEKKLTNETVFLKNVLINLLPNVSKNEKHETAAVDEKIEEYLPDSSISTNDEIVEEDIANEPVDNDTDQPNYVSHDNDEEQEPNVDCKIFSRKKLSNIDEEVFDASGRSTET